MLVPVAPSKSRVSTHARTASKSLGALQCQRPGIWPDKKHTGISLQMKTDVTLYFSRCAHLSMGHAHPPYILSG